MGVGVLGDAVACLVDVWWWGWGGAPGDVEVVVVVAVGEVSLVHAGVPWGSERFGPERVGGGQCSEAGGERAGGFVVGVDGGAGAVRVANGADVGGAAVEVVGDGAVRAGAGVASANAHGVTGFEPADVDLEVFACGDEGGDEAGVDDARFDVESGLWGEFDVAMLEQVDGCACAESGWERGVELGPVQNEGAVLG